MLQDIHIYLGIVSNNDVSGKISQLNFFFLNLEESGRRHDDSAFLFSLKNPTNDPRKLPHLAGKSSSSMRDYSHVGPCFGDGIDLYIASNANKNSDSFEKLGYTYTVPSGQAGDPFLTGATRFTLSEIETFYETTP